MLPLFYVVIEKSCLFFYTVKTQIITLGNYVDFVRHGHD